MPAEVRVNKMPAQPKPKPRARLFKLEDIPGVMRARLGWPVSASLMSRWFANPAYVMPNAVKAGNVLLSSLNSATLDEHRVTMSWALGFSRVQAALQSLQARWASPAGLTLLRQRVAAQGQGKKNTSWQFGNLSQSPKTLDASCQVNFLTLGSLSDPMDDFYGAIGEGQLNVAASGTVNSNASGGHSVTVDELGFYLRDCYDFSDDALSLVSQPLGFWGFSGVERSPQLRWDVELGDKFVEEDQKQVDSYRYEVQNDDFRAWRKLNGRGGDFMVLSDVHRVRLPTPVTVTV